MIVGGSHHGDMLEEQTFEVVHLIHKEDWEALHEQAVSSEGQNPNNMTMRTEIYKLQMLEFLGRRVLVYGYTKMSQEELLVKYITRNGDTNDRA